MRIIRRAIDAAPLHAAILRGAALLVPGRQRDEWLAEWRARALLRPRARREGNALPSASAPFPTLSGYGGTPSIEQAIQPRIQQEI